MTHAFVPVPPANRNCEACGAQEHVRQHTPPKSFLGGYAVTRSVGALITWGGRYWRWDGSNWMESSR